MRAFLDSATPDADVRAVTLAGGGERIVWRQGTGRPLLMIQGMSGTHDHWGDDLVARLVADGRSVVTVNHRGVYGTARPEPGYTVDDLADDQAAALDALGVDEPIDVFGISMGGMTAMAFAIRHPDRVRTLALGCTTAGGAAMTPPDMADMQVLFEAQQSGDRDRALRVAFEMNVSRRFWNDEQALARFVEITERGPVPVSVILSQLQAIAAHDVAARLSELTVPVAILHGTADRMLPYPNHAPIHAAIPGSTLDTFDGAGHLFYLEDPDRTADVLEALSLRAGARAPSVG